MLLSHLSSHNPHQLLTALHKLFACISPIYVISFAVGHTKQLYGSTLLLTQKICINNSGQKNKSSNEAQSHVVNAIRPVDVFYVFLAPLT